MTTEIAIMNKSAVALAADSAVTISTRSPHRNGQKILNSANKLFSLSKYAPIGLMIYGNASMLGIPWETIVKMYRKKLGQKQFNYCIDYCNDFFSFLDKFDVSEELQEQYVAMGAFGLFQQIKDELDKWAETQISQNKHVTPNIVKAKLKDLISEKYKEFLEYGKQSVFSSSKRSGLRKKYNAIIKEIAKKVFEKHPLTELQHSNLLTIAINAASIGPMDQSGVVIAGFGTKELFPSCYSFDVAAVFAGKTVKRDGRKQNITNDNSAVIIPFAQSDDVKTFMEGIGPMLELFLKNVFYKIMTQTLPDRLRNDIGDKLELNEKEKNEFRKITSQMCKGACDEAFMELRKQQQRYYIDPVVQATGFLNVSELVAMAETLVNLVSFRKQVSMESETVGGPIDVATITKGDGLVWIKRKHYFPPELNHHFFGRYFEEVKL